MNGDWLSPAQVAAELSVALPTVRAYIRSGRLPARRIRGSRLVRIARADLERLLEPLPQPNGTKEPVHVG